MASVKKEILKVIKLKPAEDEDNQSFLKRVIEAVNALEDEWDALSEAAQDWANSATRAFKADKAIPDFPGEAKAAPTKERAKLAKPEPEDEEDEEEVEEDEEEDSNEDEDEAEVEEDEEEEVEAKPAKKKAKVEAEAKPAKKKAKVADEDEEDEEAKPTKKKKVVVDTEEGDEEEDDEEEEKPAKKKKAKAKEDKPARKRGDVSDGNLSPVMFVREHFLHNPDVEITEVQKLVLKKYEKELSSATLTSLRNDFRSWMRLLKKHGYLSKNAPAHSV